MDNRGQVVGGEALLNGQGQFAHHVRGPGADQLRPQDPSAGPVGDQLDISALCPFNEALAIGAGEILSGLYRDPAALAPSSVSPTEAISGSV